MNTADRAAFDEDDRRPCQCPHGNLHGQYMTPGPCLHSTRHPSGLCADCERSAEIDDEYRRNARTAQR